MKIQRILIMAATAGAILFTATAARADDHSRSHRFWRNGHVFVEPAPAPGVVYSYPDGGYYDNGVTVAYGGHDFHHHHHHHDRNWR